MQATSSTRRRQYPLIALVSVACSLAGTALAGAPPTSTPFAQVQGIIKQRCSACHSAQPSSAIFSSAPAGVIFDSPEQIQQLALRIQAQAVDSQLMPLGNITAMTGQERQVLGAWVAQGALLDSTPDAARKAP